MFCAQVLQVPSALLSSVVASVQRRGALLQLYSVYLHSYLVHSVRIMYRTGVHTRARLVCRANLQHIQRVRIYLQCNVTVVWCRYETNTLKLVSIN